MEVLCHDDRVRDDARTVLSAHGVDPAGYQLHVVPNDRVWLRDSAPTGVVGDEGGRVRLSDGGRDRELAIHVPGYAGHNRLMDGIRLPPAPPAARRRGAPSFVLACFSERYFGAALRDGGSASLVMTRNFMAPEGYAIDAVVRGLGDNLSTAAVRDNAVRETARWQRIPDWAANTVFAKERTIEITIPAA